MLAAIAALPSFQLAAQAQSFEQLINEVLKRQSQPGTEEQPDPLLPPDLAPNQPGNATPGAPALNPVELGPRPYTPPTIELPPEDGSTPPDSASAAPAEALPADTTSSLETTPVQDAPPDLGSFSQSLGTDAAPAELVVAPGEDRTRESLQVAEVNAVTFSEEALAVGGANPLVLKAQVLLDRVGASPGAVDGYAGGNLAKAISAVETVLGLPADGVLDAEVWKAIGGDGAGDVLVEYTITETDLAYPFTAIPQDYIAQAQLPGLSYGGPVEMLSERFHIDAKLLRALNPEADFTQAGTTVWVTSVESKPVSGTASRIVADKTRGQLRAYDAQNRLLVAYPATIGSAQNPSPTGELQVEVVTPNPVFFYDPGGLATTGNTGKLTLPAGPNNPVGSTWIGLSVPACGIHGAPEPAKVGKTPALGCVRLTNWDVEELAGLVQPGVTVSFVD